MVSIKEEVSIKKEEEATTELLNRVAMHSIDKNNRMRLISRLAMMKNLLKVQILKDTKRGPIIAEVEVGPITEVEVVITKTVEVIKKIDIQTRNSSMLIRRKMMMRSQLLVMMEMALPRCRQELRKGKNSIHTHNPMDQKLHRERLDLLAEEIIEVEVEAMVNPIMRMIDE